MKRSVLFWALVIGIVVVGVFFLWPRAYYGVRWRLQAATGILLPDLRGAARPAVSSVAAPVQDARATGTAPGEPRGAPIDLRPLERAPRIATLPEPFPKLLVPMHQKKPQMGIDGAMHKMASAAGVLPEDGMYIYDLCRKVRPQRTLEVGFAEGFSAMYFLAAAKANGQGFHIAMDPFEIKDYHGIGVQKVREAGMADRFRFIDAPSIAALPAVAAEGLKFGVIFIDGDHRYDTQVVDFVIADSLIPKGGFILLHDVWMASTQKLISFIEKNRTEYRRHPTNVNMATFEKIGEDQREWHHFIDF
jgi:predicted O-methyltransferase YrrM